MSFQVSPRLFIDSIKRNNLRFNNKSICHCRPMIHNTTNLSMKNIKNNFNDNTYLEPTYDIYTDCKFIKTFNANLLNDSPKVGTNKNNFVLSYLTINKYNKMKENSAINNQLSYDKNEPNYEKKDDEINNEINIKNNLEKNNSENKYYNLNNNLNNEKNNNALQFQNDKNNYYFDYNNDNYNEIKNKSKNKENKSLDKMPLNNVDYDTNRNLFSKSNSARNIQNKNINNDLLFDNKIINDRKDYYNHNTKINPDYLVYLKKENEQLKKINLSNRQLINNLFNFINQLSQNFSPNKKIFDMSCYSVNANDLSTDLNILNQHILNACNIYSRNNSIKNSGIYGNKNSNSKMENIIGERFSFGQEFNRENSRSINNINNNNNTLNNSNRYKNLCENNNNDNSNFLGLSIKKNDNEIIQNDRELNNYKNNFGPKENEIIQSLNNIIYK